ncbi:hypothetical protein MMC30_005051 [Trapelia coarctata]|nr:hypothetical protein [Trapelia coarctata]
MCPTIHYHCAICLQELPPPPPGEPLYTNDTDLCSTAKARSPPERCSSAATPHLPPAAGCCICPTETEDDWTATVEAERSDDRARATAYILADFDRTRAAIEAADAATAVESIEVECPSTPTPEARFPATTLDPATTLAMSEEQLFIQAEAQLEAELRMLRESRTRPEEVEHARRSWERRMRARIRRERLEREWLETGGYEGRRE